MKPLINFILKCFCVGLMAGAVCLSAIVAIIMWDTRYFEKVSEVANDLFFGKDKLS